MANIRSLQRSFGGGEVTPEFYGRIDDNKYQTGLATCRNFEVLPHGPVRNRAGTAFVREVKDSTKATRVISFNYSTTQTMVLELGDQYIRFHTQGATLLAPAATAWSNATAYAVGDLASRLGVTYYCILAHTNQQPPNATYWYPLPSAAYEIPSPYLEADLFDLHFVQSADVLTIAHPSYAPRELRRQGATNWVLSTISFTSDLAAPGSVSATATVATGTGFINHVYKVTAVDSTGIEESLASSSSTCSNNLLTSGNYNTITWGSVSGASRYNVYKQSNGLFAYLGQTDALTFRDDNITPDLSKTPPIANDPFVSTNNYPGAVSYFEQRRAFAGTNNKPQNMWMTRSGTESNLAYSIPTRDDDAIAFRIAAREANTIRHIVPLNNLILLTSAAEYRISPVNSDSITPTTISVRPQSYVGASNAQPVIVNNNLIYVAARGGHMRELAYAWQSSGYVTGDLSLRAPHLFDNYTINDLAYSKAPYPVVWATSSSGKLLALTYVPEQQVGAWHQHDTYTGDGEVMSQFESCAVVAEGTEDYLYCVVRRYIDGGWVRYIERLASRAFTDPEDAFFVDCGATYDGSPATVISGLTWLEGETVNILADGAVQPPQVVTGGEITLEVEASVVQVGLPITADIQTLPLAFEAQAYGQGRQKNVNKVYIRVNRSGGIFAGPSFDKLTEAKQRTTEVYGAPPDLLTQEVPITITPSWSDSGQLCVRQSAPLPLTIVAMSLEASIGG